MDKKPRKKRAKPTVVPPAETLCGACDAGHSTVALSLLCNGADPNAHTAFGDTPLIRASCHGMDEVVEALLNTGVVTVDHRNSIGCTALHAAAHTGSRAVVERLLRAGADKNRKSFDGRTPLYIACVQGTEGAADALLHAGASTVESQDDGFTPLAAAAAGGYRGIVALLLRARANEDAATPTGWTPLMQACSAGHKDVAELLLRHGADVSKKNKDRESALAVAIRGNRVDIVELLLHSGADINETHFDATHHQVTPLYEACKNGNTAIATAFIRAGADLKAGPNWHTPLLAACEGGHADIVKALLTAKVPTKSLTENHSSAMLIAAKVGHAETVKALLKIERSELNLVLNYPNNQKWTPLTIAASHDDSEIAIALARAGAEFAEAPVEFVADAPLRKELLRYAPAGIFMMSTIRGDSSANVLRGFPHIIRFIVKCALPRWMVVCSNNE